MQSTKMTGGGASDDVLSVYIGWDRSQIAAFQVCRYSLLRHTSQPLHIVPLMERALRYSGLFTRPWHIDDQGRMVDDQDQLTFSTDFAFVRFLVSAMQQYQGWALFCDCDFLFQDDVAKCFAFADEQYAVQVVKNNHRPQSETKMLNQQQGRYQRKNWSSLVLWNCGHAANRFLTTEAINTRPGRWLHGFSWLGDDEIGDLPPHWNKLVGVDESVAERGALHYTLGGPWLGPEFTKTPEAEEWLRVQNLMMSERGLKYA